MQMVIPTPNIVSWGMTKDDFLEFGKREKEFKKLEPGTLFNLGREKFYIAVNKVDRNNWQVIELNTMNIKKIKQVCHITTKQLYDMCCMEINKKMDD